MISNWDFLILIIKSVDSPSSCFLSSCGLKRFIVSSACKGLICFVTVLFTFRFCFVFLLMLGPYGFLWSRPHIYGHFFVQSSLYVHAKPNTTWEFHCSWVIALSVQGPAGGKLPCCFPVPGDQAFLVYFTLSIFSCLFSLFISVGKGRPANPCCPLIMLRKSCKPLPLKYLLSTLWSWISWCLTHRCSGTQFILQWSQNRVLKWRQSKTCSRSSVPSNSGRWPLLTVSFHGAPWHCWTYGQLEAVLEGQPWASHLFSGASTEGWSHTGCVSVDKASALYSHRSPITH